MQWKYEKNVINSKENQLLLLLPSVVYFMCVWQIINTRENNLLYNFYVLRHENIEKG